MNKFKDVDTLKGVFAPADPKTHTSEILMDVWDANTKKRQAVRSVHLIQRLIKSEESRIREAKKSKRWYKITYRRLQRLIRSNPDKIYIYDHAVIEDPECPGHFPHWLDIHIAVPVNVWGKVGMRWICTLASYALGKDDQESTKKFGGEWHHLEPDDPEDRFDEMFFDLPNGFESEKMACDCFRKWMEYFLPELADREIVFKDIDDKDEEPIKVVHV